MTMQAGNDDDDDDCASALLRLDDKYPLKLPTVFYDLLASKTDNVKKG